MSNQQNYITLNCCNCGRHLAEKRVSKENQWGGIRITCHNCKTVNIFETENKVNTQPYGERERYTKKTA